MDLNFWFLLLNLGNKNSLIYLLMLITTSSSEVVILSMLISSKNLFVLFRIFVIFKAKYDLD